MPVKSGLVRGKEVECLDAQGACPHHNIRAQTAADPPASKPGIHINRRHPRTEVGVGVHVLGKETGCADRLTVVKRYKGEGDGSAVRPLAQRRYERFR